MKTGRPKKYDNLVKTNVYVEQKTLDDLNLIVEYLNQKSQFKNMTMAAVIRKILADSSKSFIQKNNLVGSAASGK